MATSLKKTWLLLIIPALYFLLPGCSEQTKENGEKEQTLVRVETAKPATGLNNTYIGTVEASVSIPLSFQVTGSVERVWVTEGERVSQGQPLASIDERSYRDALSIAEAKAMQAEDAWKRLSELYQKKSLPEIKYVEIESGVSQARAAVSLAKTNLDDCLLKAPRSGIIGKRSIEPGENAIPYQTAFILLNADQLNVKISVPEKEISGITTGKEAIITVPALENAQFAGRVLRKSIVAQPITHTYNALISIQCEEPRLLPGMVCRVEFGAVKSNAFASVPMQVIQTDGKGIHYLLIPDATGTKVLRRNIIPGQLLGLHIVIMDGLSPGEPFISEGYQRLDTTMNIKILR